jgi:hypothetical protein
MALNSFYDNFSRLDSSKGIMGDYAHAAALYRRNNFRLAPKNKFLYHIVIEVNPVALSVLGRNVFNQLNRKEYNLLASSADLPSYTINTETLNQYNRKKVIQTQINYNPISIEFHDDNAGLTTLLWEAYYRYYYQDGNYDTEGSKPRAYQTKLYDTDIANTYRHGFNRRRNTDVPFFNSIIIHQLHPQNKESTFTSFTLVNPLIEEWQHDRVDQADGGGVMKNTMRLAYESVFYDRAITSPETVQNFADIQHYDTVPSPYNSVSTSSVAKDTADNTFWAEIFQDLLSNVVDLTGFNSTQKQEQLPLSIQPINQIVRQPATTTNYFPSTFNNTFIESTPVQLRNQNLSLSDQEYKRQLQNNPQKLADYAAGQSVRLISVYSGLNRQESKQFYDSLSPTIKLQIEASALNNFNEMNQGTSSPIGTNFESDLKDIGVIG